REIRDHRSEVGPAVTEELGQRAIHDPGSIAGFSGRAAQVGAAFLVGIASDASADAESKSDPKRLPQPGLAAAPPRSARPFWSASQTTPRPRRIDVRSAACPSAGLSGRAAHGGAAFFVGIASDASADAAAQPP